MTDVLAAPVVSHVVMDVSPSRAEDFAGDLQRALPLMVGRPGCHGARVLRSEGTPGRFVLLAGWDSVQAHEEGFHGSPEYASWRALLHPYLDPVPVPEHARTVARADGTPYPVLADGARFDHVCVAGRALRPLLDRWVELLGGEVLWGEVLAVGAVVVTVGYLGGGHVELMVPTPGSTFLDSFLARTDGAGGLHHVTFVVPDLRAAVAAARATGARVVGERYDDPVWSEAFVHPSTGGVLLQYATPGPELRAPLVADLDALLAAAGT